MPIDPSSHIPLIYRVINQMAIPPTEEDEAFTVGLVSITEAACKYDPSKNVPIANWLGRNIRWSLQTWRKGLRNKNEHEAHIVYDAEGSADALRRGFVTEEYLASLYPGAADPEAHVGLRDTFAAIRDLPTLQRAVILGTVLGYNGVELAEALKVTPVAISRARKKAQATLRDALK